MEEVTFKRTFRARKILIFKRWEEKLFQKKITKLINE